MECWSNEKWVSSVIDGGICEYRDKDMAVCEECGRVAGEGRLSACWYD